MWYFCDVLYAMQYDRVSCFVVRESAVSRRYINICKCDMFSVVNVYLDHLKFCVVCINGQMYVCCCECNIVLMSVMSPHPALCNILVRMVVKLCTLGVFALGVSLVSRIVMISACVT